MLGGLVSAWGGGEALLEELVEVGKVAEASVVGGVGDGVAGFELFGGVVEAGVVDEVGGGEVEVLSAESSDVLVGVAGGFDEDVDALTKGGVVGGSFGEPTRQAG